MKKTSKKLFNFKKFNKEVEVKEKETETTESTISFMPRVDSKEEAIKEEKVISDKEIVDRACNMVNAIKHSRIEGSKEERETANYILKESERIFGTKGALEPFYVSNFSHNYGLMIIGAIFLIALITFPFSPLAGLILGFVAYAILINRAIFKVDIFKSFTKKDVSFNVVNEIPSKAKTENTIIIASNYSSSRNWLFNRFFKLNTKALLISTVIYELLLFICLVTLSAGVNNVGLYAFTGIMMFLQVIMCFFFHTFDKKNLNIKHGLSGVAVSFMIVDYFNQHKKLINDNTKIVFVAMGGGVDGANGTRAFVKEHFKLNNDYPNAKVISIEEIVDDVALLSKDSKNKVTSIAYERLCKDPINKQVGILKGFGTNIFDSVGVDAVAIGESQKEIKVDLNTPKDDKELSLDEAITKFYQYIPIITDIMHDEEKEEE